MVKKQAVKSKNQPAKSRMKSKTVKTKTIKKPSQKKTGKAAKSKTVKQEKKALVKPARKTSTPRERRFKDIKKHLLLQKKALLMGALEALNELPGPTVFPDLGDQATAEMDRNFMLRLRGRERKLLKKIDEAIERIDQHVFGICDRCGDEIDIRRLEARPVTTMCIDCKILEEEEEKLRET